MFQKLLRAIFGGPSQPAPKVRLYESGQWTLASLPDRERMQMYERIAQHQRLIEIEEDLRDRF